MDETHGRVHRFFGVLSLLLAATFVIAALLHFGVRIPIGVDEPPILPAGIVESTIALLFGIAAYTVLAEKASAWTALVVAHAAGIAGVTLGIVATALAPGRGPSTRANYIYHRVTLAIFVAGLILLLTPAGKRAVKGQRSP